jgi:glycine hydroxymethyltransferase
VDIDQARFPGPPAQTKLISIGASGLSRARLGLQGVPRKIADEVGAFLWADIAHTGRLDRRRGTQQPDALLPTWWTTTTHKTLRGPRGGMILMGKDFENPFGIVAPKSGRTRMMSELLDSQIIPGIQGGP